MVVVVDIGQAVEDHAVDRLQVPQLDALPAVEIVRHLGHILHAPCDGDINLPEGNGVGRQVNGLHAAGADFIDGRAGDRVRDTRAHGGLSGRGLTQAGL